jgi:hypothetical protein
MKVRHGLGLGNGRVGSIWKITTGLSAALATMLFVIAAFRGLLAQSSRYVTQALPGVVVAMLGPQAAALLPSSQVR